MIRRNRRALALVTSVAATALVATACVGTGSVSVEADGATESVDATEADGAADLEHDHGLDDHHHDRAAAPAGRHAVAVEAAHGLG